ncbi:manganase accumulation protein MntS [Staphylococcus aureus]|nr:manganase accumulation protein MntS [Staphylococcus aureus]
MNEFKRCITVCSNSPFKGRLMLNGMLCEMINRKPQPGKPNS